MIMPEMGGRECFNELREQRADVRVVMCSGFTRDDDLKQLLQDGLTGFIRKPFQGADLAKMVRRALQA
jgi:CheY-like chemotaxis protein